MVEELGTEASESGTKRCPFCAEDIKAQAIKCRYCGSMLTEVGGATETETAATVEVANVKEDTVTPNVFGGIGCLILLVLFTMYVIENYGDVLSPLLEPSVPVTQPSDPVTESRVFVESERVAIGSLSYQVIRSWWADRLGEAIVQRPDAAFLLVEFEVRNDGSTAFEIPIPEAIDGQGREHKRANDFFLDGHLGVVDKLNPTVSKNVKVAFDVPRGDGYKLRVSGGGETSDTALIPLMPTR